MRSAAATVDFIPEFVYDKLRFNPTKTEAIQATDRVGTYASTLLGELN
jgi:hypothetical protein